MWMMDMCWIPYVESRSESCSSILFVKISLMAVSSVHTQNQKSTENFHPTIVNLSKTEDINCRQTWRLRNLLYYLLLELFYCHALHLLFGVAQVDGLLLSFESAHHYLIDFSHFFAV